MGPSTFCSAWTSYSTKKGSALAITSEPNIPLQVPITHLLGVSSSKYRCKSATANVGGLGKVRMKFDYGKSEHFEVSPCHGTHSPKLKPGQAWIETATGNGKLSERWPFQAVVG